MTHKATLKMPPLGMPRVRVPPFCMQSIAPPARPARKSTYGDLCFKATCIISIRGAPVGMVVGYDTTPDIADATERVCRLHASSIGDCGEAEITVIPTTMQCPRQFYMAYNGVTKEIR